jgi:hypothetical protein
MGVIVTRSVKVCNITNKRNFYILLIILVNPPQAPQGLGKIILFVQIPNPTMYTAASIFVTQYLNIPTPVTENLIKILAHTTPTHLHTAQLATVDRQIYR